MSNTLTRILYWWCRKFHGRFDGHGRDYVDLSDPDVSMNVMELACEICGRNYDVKTKWRKIDERRMSIASREVTFRGVCFPTQGTKG
jgi:hypothetical protein